MNDREIIDLFWQRSERAITETDRKYGGYCRAVATNILASPEDTEECVSDTWLSAWNAMPDKRPERLGAFLAKITRNHALTRLAMRRAKRRGGGETDLALDELDECVPAGCDLEHEVEERELARAIDAFLSRLTEEEQLAFVCRYWYLAPERAIAEKLGCSRSRVNAMLRRTREKLRGYLIQEGLCEIPNDC